MKEALRHLGYILVGLVVAALVVALLTILLPLLFPLVALAMLWFIGWASVKIARGE